MLLFFYSVVIPQEMLLEPEGSEKLEWYKMEFK